MPVCMKSWYIAAPLLLFGAIWMAACQQPVEGCTNPRAENFNPEADQNTDCTFYQLTVEWQHHADSLPSDTVVQGSVLTDAAGEAFLVDDCRILGSQVRLTALGGAPISSPESILLPTVNGQQTVEDNFFGIGLGQYSADATGWITLGSFDTLTLQLGLDTVLSVVSPSSLDNPGHPLGSSANPYVYDSLQNQYNTLLLTVIQPNNNNRSISIALTEPITYRFVYPITVLDGMDIPIRLRLDYGQLLQGIRWSTDTEAAIRTRLLQNLPNALTTY